MALFAMPAYKPIEIVTPEEFVPLAEIGVSDTNQITNIGLEKSFVHRQGRRTYVHLSLMAVVLPPGSDGRRPVSDREPKPSAFVVARIG